MCHRGIPLRSANENGLIRGRKRSPLHLIQQRYLAENLVRLKRADDQERFAASQRRGRIDPNPHQVEAVIFALSRIPEGGCILADEVGLGKTIEAGLVMAQMLAEGTRRILVILPKPLLGQWKQELYSLFGIEAREGSEDLIGEGVFLVGREFAGSEKGATLLAEGEPFGLCIIDEAHEIFAGIYKRFDKYGSYKEEAKEAVMAHRVRTILGRTPVMLLTATPIQNSLTELWGLVQYVEPTGTLLGDVQTFREVFCDGDDRKVQPDQAFELRKRIATVCQRTLRRQAQEFLEQPFVDRQAQLFEYRMTPEEKALYDGVTEYLLEPELCAFRGSQRRLLLIGFHRRMASSLAALAASLNKVAERLERMVEGGSAGDLETELLLSFGQDFEDELEPNSEATQPTELPRRDKVLAELERVRALIATAESLPHDSKAQALLEALTMLRRRQQQGLSSGKAVVFTESLTTQDYLYTLLREAGYPSDEITLFRGGNKGKRVEQALQRWQAEVGDRLPPASLPSRSVAVRLALVHEFATCSRVFITTEAGAKGLNLQFADTVINYDLPWNPQRIEQRIGRCHRYGQERTVTVINFLAKDNEAQRLTFEILSQKLDLFGRLLDASDRVLYEPGTNTPETLVSTLGSEFEASLQKIYDRARTVDEIEQELRQLRDSVSAQRKAFEETMKRTANLIDTWLDESVRHVFRRIQEELPESLKSLDRNLQALLLRYLDRRDVSYRKLSGNGQTVLEIQAHASLPQGYGDGVTLVVGPVHELEEGEALHPGHPLIARAVDDIRQSTRQPVGIRIACPPGSPLQCYRGKRGRLWLEKVIFNGFERNEQLLVVALLEGESQAIPPAEATALLQETEFRDEPDLVPLSWPKRVIQDSLEEAVLEAQLEAGNREQQRFEKAAQQVERYLEDRLLVLNRQRLLLEERLERQRHERDSAISSQKRGDSEKKVQKTQAKLDALQQEIDQLSAREDENYQKWRQFAYDKRFHSPQRETLMEVEFVVE